MAIEIITVVQTAIINTIGGLISNIFYIILFIWGVKILSNSIKKTGSQLIEKVPEWITKYEKIKIHNRTIERAMGIKSI